AAQSSKPFAVYVLSQYAQYDIDWLQPGAESILISG
ncbi:unnamed protein product, partial [marine sediment metagenome]